MKEASLDLILVDNQTNNNFCTMKSTLLVSLTYNCFFFYSKHHKSNSILVEHKNIKVIYFSSSILLKKKSRNDKIKDLFLCNLRMNFVLIKI